ncbi:MAG: TlpA family protein disulfide reductase [Bacteroidota bacterium]|nr:TlpA family protein disulfide reductase [Bacteroidota bacterium]
MKRLFFLLTVVLLLAFASGRKVPIGKIDPLLARIEKGGDTTFVVNFWATWCGPCVKELPYFTALDSARSKDKVKVILVSLDFKKDISTRLVPFIEKRKIKTEVIFLDETNDNEWIPKADGEWQGNIPATLIRNPAKGYRRFLPRETTYHELDSLVSSVRE